MFSIKSSELPQVVGIKVAERDYLEKYKLSDGTEFNSSSLELFAENFYNSKLFNF